jgi:hypothetical protein
MSIETLIQKDPILSPVNKLIVYTDTRNWQGILNEEFTAEVLFDMTSLAGGEPAVLAAAAITAAWDEGLKPLEAVHHQTGNFDVEITGNNAVVTCYGIAYHYRQHPSGNNTRVFVGSYMFNLVQLPLGWRINTFTFIKKFIDGNVELA